MVGRADVLATNSMFYNRGQKSLFTLYQRQYCCCILHMLFISLLRLKVVGVLRPQRACNQPVGNLFSVAVDAKETSALVSSRHKSSTPSQVVLITLSLVKFIKHISRSLSFGRIMLCT